MIEFCKGPDVPFSEREAKINSLQTAIISIVYMIRTNDFGTEMQTHNEKEDGFMECLIFSNELPKTIACQYLSLLDGGELKQFLKISETPYF